VAVQRVIGEYAWLAFALRRPNLDLEAFTELSHIQADLTLLAELNSRALALRVDDLDAKLRARTGRSD
jgi:hypothetical protein